ncbi:metallophosphoesterase [Nonomuraea longicatena]|uniref:Metallophosphoesterase n=1 Tax=Nonomuraea longicatena TaxID=83682 RepID=A0ABP3ZB13_9ACTN
MAFVVMMVAVVVAVHYYMWQRLVKATTARGSRARGVLTWALAGLGLLVMVTFVSSRLMAGAGWAAWPGYIWFGMMFYLAVILVVLEIPRAVWSLVWRKRAARSVTRTADPVAVKVGAAESGADTNVVEAAAAVKVTDIAGDTKVVEVADIVDIARDTEVAGVAPDAKVGGASDPGEMSRRLFIGRTTALVAGVGAMGTVGYGMTTALGPPVIEPVKVVLPKLDPRLKGLRFAVVSDIHLGPLTGIGHAQRITRMINELEADVVAIVGDMVDGTVAELGRLAKPLGSLESRYGAFFVTGNHEYYTANGPEEWIQELDRLGIRSLRNERVEIAHQGAVLDLAGVNDVIGAQQNDGPDFEKALGGREAGRSTVLLAHQPVQVDKAAEYDVDLQLSGHTHGGQIVPFNLAVPLQQPVVSGLATVKGTQVYVTRGAGFWGPPIRVGAPPEITLLELS